MAAKQSSIPDWKELRRWRALNLKHDGRTHHEIAAALNITKGAVSQWMTRAAQEGEEALRARPHLGVAPKLTKDQLQMIPEFLSHGAETYGFRGEVWTCARIISNLMRANFYVAFEFERAAQ
jgi:transposase